MRRAIKLSSYLTLALALLVSACGVNPVREANTPELKADALYAEYVIALESGARLIADPSVPDAVKSRIQSTHRSARPFVEELQNKRALISKLRIESSADLPAALLALDELLRAATPKVRALEKETAQ